jgi:hypothetical protein
VGGEEASPYYGLDDTTYMHHIVTGQTLIIYNCTNVLHTTLSPTNTPMAKASPDHLVAQRGLGIAHTPRLHSDASTRHTDPP